MVLLFYTILFIKIYAYIYIGWQMYWYLYGNSVIL
jgi:hypothetical protein